MKINITEEKLAELEGLGFRRWTNGGMDRLYINASALGLTTTRYNTGNISSAEFRGSRISNAEGRRMYAAKTYVDLVKGLIVSDNASLAQAAVEISGLEVEEHDCWDRILKVSA